MRTRVVALGQAAAGDDGAGFAVLEALRRAKPPANVSLERVAEASGLLPILAEGGRVIVVDAVLRPPAGEVLVLSSRQIAESRLATVSTHGMGLSEALALSRALDPSAADADVRIVGITIERAERGTPGLSAPVSAAIPEAVGRILALAAPAAPSGCSRSPGGPAPPIRARRSFPGR